MVLECNHLQRQFFPVCRWGSHHTCVVCNRSGGPARGAAQLALSPSQSQCPRHSTLENKLSNQMEFAKGFYFQCLLSVCLMSSHVSVLSFYINSQCYLFYALSWTQSIWIWQTFSLFFLYTNSCLTKNINKNKIIKCPKMIKAHMPWHSVQGRECSWN